MSDRQDDDWSELWATFSVRDHTRPGAFIAEVLFYDKLLIPVVPTQADGLSDEEAKQEWERWNGNGWDPARQTQICGILGSHAEPIPWTAERQHEWKTAMAAKFSDARRNGYFESGSVLQRFAPTMARSVVAVSQYRSLEELERDVGIRRRQTPAPLLPGSTLLAVLGFEMLVPEDPDRGDFQALADAVKVASTDEYREARRTLYDWQKRFVRDGATDQPSVSAALKEMNNLVLSLRRTTRREGIWKALKSCFAFLGAASKAAAAVPVPQVTAATSVAGGIAALGTFVVDTASDRGPVPPGLPAATLIASTQERLGLV
jgi:hypothetical protein